MRKLGVPYKEGFEEEVHQNMAAQAEGIAQNLSKEGIEIASDREIIALNSLSPKTRHRHPPGTA